MNEYEADLLLSADFNITVALADFDSIAVIRVQTIENDPMTVYSESIYLNS